MTIPHDNEPVPDHELRETASLLDRLGTADRASAPPELDSKILDGVARVYAPGPIGISTPDVPWWRGTVVRTAAAVVLTGTIGLLVLSRGGTGTTGPHEPNVDITLVEMRIDGLLAITSGSSDEFRDRLASIELWADTLDTDIENGWIDADLGEFDYEEGAL